MAKETVDETQLLLDQKGLGGGRICGGSDGPRMVEKEKQISAAPQLDDPERR